MHTTVDPTLETVVLSGYRLLSVLYEGAKTLVYRGIRLADEQAVVIKLLRQEYPTFHELLQFRNQYTITKNLNIPGIIRPDCLETCDHRLALVMLDRGDISLRQYSQTHELQIPDVMAIALQLCEILHALYQQRIIHKDIKPANILIHPESKQVSLIDFSIASLLPKETEEVKHPNVLEGTLAYLSPEQTGRMNRGVDYRSDFYALGVTLFELLTGELPFRSLDPMELVHCHLAVQPPLAHAVNPEIPPILAAIIAKLMAKNAEDRYQSALGLKYDLQRCWELWQQGNPIGFPLAERDLCDRFTIPERLYGREAEVMALLEAFNRVSAGTTELLLVVGFSGIGKTAVVNEVHKPIVRQRGYFIKGKYDQFNRNIPFSAFVQAFRDLMAQLLSESDAELQTWKTQILQALGDNGQVIIEVIPELERILGIQPPATELSGTAAQNRFNLLFQKFIQVFTTPTHPLAMFLDDLQWADSASLNLIEVLMAESETGYLLLIGAYRDNEVSPAHPLMLTLDAVGKAGATVNTITLQPLSQTSFNQLVSNTLNCEIQLAQPLTELVYQKTQGNPFFATQFLKALHQDRLITFDLQTGHWQCDIVQVREAALTDDVVEFMALQLKKLPQETQSVLKLAACIGAQFDLQTLAIVSQQSESDTAAALWKALQEGLILPLSEVYKFYLGEVDANQTVQPETLSYKFLHDRVQQAAYSLIADDRKQETHLRIGRLLLQSAEPEQQAESCFQIINQVNAAIQQITDPIERERFAQLNLLAGKKAKLTTAYVAATQYFSTGIKLLNENPWQQQYELTLDLHLEAAEVAYLSGDFAQMNQHIDSLLAQVDGLLDRLKVQKVQLQGLKAQNQLHEAIDLGLQMLQSLGIELPAQPTQEDVLKFFEETQIALQGKRISDLINLPVMTDPNMLAATHILFYLAPVVYMAAPQLLPIATFKEIQLALHYGNAPAHAHAYSAMGLILCGFFNQINEGYEFGQLALRLLDKLETKAFHASTSFVAVYFTQHWKAPLQTSLKPLLEAYESGLATGDIEHASFSVERYGLLAYLSGTVPLSELESQMRTFGDFMQKRSQLSILQAHRIVHQVVLNLLGAAENACHLVGEVYDETIELKQQIDANYTLAIYYVYLNKLILTYLFSDLTGAVEFAALAEQNLVGGSGSPLIPIFYTYDSLVRLATYPKADSSTQDEIFNKVNANQEKLKNWAIYAPTNCQHKVDLVEAELQQVLAQRFAAADLYDRAIAGAKTNDYTQEEALANELAAKFYLDWGKEKVAAGYMQEAYYCYARWGAKAKIDDLESRYPDLLRPILQQPNESLGVLGTLATIAAPAYSIYSGTRKSSTITSVNTTLDFVAILKASQALSGTIQLDDLLRQLTQIILQNSGADRCALILPNEAGEWFVQAIATPTETQLCSEPLDHHPHLPIKLIQYVKNVQEAVVIDNLQTNLPVIGDYFTQQQPKSVLSLPILNQGQLLGILYLENRSARGVFSSDRILILNFLCTQAAISLENAQLYNQAQQTLTNLQQAQLQMIQSEKMSALGNLVAGVAHEINNPVGCIVGNVGAAQDYINDLLSLIDLYQAELPQPSTKIADELAAIDLEYVREDLPKLIRAMQDGGDRIKSISQSLRTFSRADSDVKQKFNIHDGINSTVLILRHRLKANDRRPEIEVVTDYGAVPALDCFPGQLNQVFMNILANAIDALDESNMGQSFTEIQTNPNRITIRTVLEENQVKIAIADNGQGMTDEVKNRIFDHLFTTKEVGKGTGLGLAIAQQIIVEKHGGAIEVNSEVGKGTEFILTFPLI